jgi:4-coumarate--CoA ligase
LKRIIEKIFLNFNESDVVFEQGYALTESCGIATLGIRKERNSHFGSAGALAPGIEAKVVSLETGRPLPPNQQGELWFRGPNIMSGICYSNSDLLVLIDGSGLSCFL